MTMEYKFVQLPVGPVPRSVGFAAVLNMELNEYGSEGWRIIQASRNGIGFTPLEVVFERNRDA
jgi:hypothetical protein